MVTGLCILPPIMQHNADADYSENLFRPFISFSWFYYKICTKYQAARAQMVWVVFLISQKTADTAKPIKGRPK